MRDFFFVKAEQPGVLLQKWLDLQKMEHMDTNDAMRREGPQRDDASTYLEFLFLLLLLPLLPSLPPCRVSLISFTFL